MRSFGLFHPEPSASAGGNFVRQPPLPHGKTTDDATVALCLRRDLQSRQTEDAAATGRPREIRELHHVMNSPIGKGRLKKYPCNDVQPKPVRRSATFWLSTPSATVDKPRSCASSITDLTI